MSNSRLANKNIHKLTDSIGSLLELRNLELSLNYNELIDKELSDTFEKLRSLEQIEEFRIEIAKNSTIRDFTIDTLGRTFANFHKLKVLYIDGSEMALGNYGLGKLGKAIEKC